MNRRDDRGIALLITIMTMMFVAALGAAVVLTTSSEAFIASAFRGGHQAFYAADGAAEWALADLAGVADWTALAAGPALSTFVDGAPGGLRSMGSGTFVDLSRVAAINPGWRLYAYGPLDGLTSAARESGFYVAVLVAPAVPAAPNRLRVRAFAFGARSAQRAVEVTILRTPAGVRQESWAVP